MPDGSNTAGTVNVTTATVVSNSVTTLIAANPNRISLKLINEAGATNVTVGFNSSVVLNSGYANVAQSGGTLLFDVVSGPSVPQTAVYAIGAGSVTNTIRIIEFVK